MKLDHRINVERLEDKVARAPRHTGRDDRATQDLVLDPRTKLILFKLINQGIVENIYGCISTGKEANVYHGVRLRGSDTEDLALKIYKTSILVFKDRDRYVSGEYRFRSGYSKRNPRKMVRLWAEKEMRNLRRMRTAGLPCPAARLLRQHVLVMDFVGKDGQAAPRLKDARLSAGKAASAYGQTVDLMRRMYQACRLVHADLSEYNLLWQSGRVWVIDVSQSVEMDHPRALEFLRMDCANVTDFFGRKCSLRVMTPRELFDYVVRTDLETPHDEAEYLSSLWSTVKHRNAGDPGGHWTAEESVAHEVFMQTYIPRSLNEVSMVDAERDQKKLAAGGGGDDIYYQTVTGMMRGDRQEEEDEDDEDEDEGEDETMGERVVSFAPGTASEKDDSRPAQPLGVNSVRITDEWTSESAPPVVPIPEWSSGDWWMGSEGGPPAASGAGEAEAPAAAAAGAAYSACNLEGPVTEDDITAALNATVEAVEGLGFDSAILAMLPGLKDGTTPTADRGADVSSEDEDEEEAEAEKEKDPHYGEPGHAGFTIKGATKEEKKAHAARIKEAAREKRQEKMKKHVKKKKERANKKPR